MDIKYRLDIRKDSYIEVAKAVKGYKGSKLDADKFNSLSQEERIKQLRLKSKEVFDLGKRNIRCLSKEHEDKTPSMGFCEDTGGFHCFACGCSFDIIDIIGTAFHLKSFGEKYKKAVQLLVEFGADTAYHPKFKNWKGNSSQSYSKNSTYTSTYNGKKNRSSSYDDVPKAMQKALHNPHYYKISDFSYKKSSECLGYMQIRGIELCLSQGLDICAFADKYNIRGWEYDGALYLVFINDNGSVCRRWIGGAVNSHTDVRWWNSKGETGIFNERDLYKNDVVFVCEGIFDALTVLALGYNAVSINSIQNVSLLKDKTDIKAVVLMDSDKKGKEAAKAVNANRSKGAELFVPDFLNDEYNGDSILSQFKDVNEVVAIDFNRKNIASLDELKAELSRLYKEALQFYKKRGL